MKPNKDLLISITKGNATKEEYSAYQKEKQRNSDDLKIDLTTSVMDRENFHGAKNVKENISTHTVKSEVIKNIGKQDILVTQVPNLNEAGFFAGMANLISYIREEEKDIKIKGFDPCTDYFFSNDIDLKSNFFADFNTYAKQGTVDLSKYEELNEIIKIFEKYIKSIEPKFIGFGLIDGNIDASLFFAEHLKSTFPNIKIILGGCGVGLLGRNEDNLNLSVASNQCYDIKKYWFIDYIINGDGEKTLIELFYSNFKNLEKKDVCVAGRIMALRKMGKASFIQVMDDTGQIQIFIKRDNYYGFKSSVFKVTNNIINQNLSLIAKPKKLEDDIDQIGRAHV